MSDNISGVKLGEVGMGKKLSLSGLRGVIMADNFFWVILGGVG